MKTKRYARALVRKIEDAAEGVLAAVIGSTDSVDRYGEVIDQSSWDLKHFKKNPVILWAHNLTFGEDRPPIGKAVNVALKDGKLVFDIKFDMADPFAADIFRKYKEGFLNAFSVGFIPHSVERLENEEAERILKNNELLELSAVPVPANPEALQALRSRSFQTRSWKGMLDEAEKEKEDSEGEDEHIDKEKSATLSDEQVKSLTETVTESVKKAIKPELKAIISEALPKAPSENSETPRGEAQKVQRTAVQQAVKILQSALAQANVRK